jgi:drug/metabolite transporter (DMT)-like permease
LPVSEPHSSVSSFDRELAISKRDFRHAYVNPVVAVLLGYFLGGEALGLRTILGTLFVLISVVVIITTRAKKGLAAPIVEDAG